MRIVSVVALAAACASAESETSPQAASVKVVNEQVIPQMDGAKLKTTILEVSYPPGGTSAAHRHPCPVIGYVLEGRYRTKIGDGPETIYQKGDTFYEPPNGVHQVSANASTTEPVRFLAWFLCDSDARLSTPAN